MINLLTETIDVIKQNEHTEEDVDFVQYVDTNYDTYEKTVHQMNWYQFKLFAGYEYDNGYGGEEVNTTLKIVFKDGTWLERAEYDGSEWWEFRKVPVKQEFDKDITGDGIFYARKW